MTVKISISKLTKLILFSIFLIPSSINAEPRNKNTGIPEYAQQEAVNYKSMLNMKFEDIPLPERFNLIPEESFVFTNDFMRLGMAKYRGRGDVTPLTFFFKKQMPLFNWVLGSSIEHSKSILTFQKEGQICIILIEPDARDMMLTIVSVPNNGVENTLE